MDELTGNDVRANHGSRQSSEVLRSASATVNSISSVIVRGLDGSISEWNKAAEKHYGWSRRQAVGNVSHLLLNTVFPTPLSQINHELISKGYWEGFLIHTLSDGRRVKVHSRWELANEDQAGSSALKVVEMNSVLGAVSPETAHLVVPLTAGAKLRQILWQKKIWWIAPFLVVLAICTFLLRFADEVPLVPLLE